MDLTAKLAFECGHKHHSECIDEYRRSSRLRHLMERIQITCPQCRKPERCDVWEEALNEINNADAEGANESNNDEEDVSWILRILWVLGCSV